MQIWWQDRQLIENGIRNMLRAISPEPLWKLEEITRSFGGFAAFWFHYKFNDKTPMKKVYSAIKRNWKKKFPDAPIPPLKKELADMPLCSE